MKVGLIARCDRSGLAVQTSEWHRHMRPDRVLLVRMGSDARGTEHPELYAETETVETGPNVHNDTVARFIEGLDVVFTVEGAYRDDLGYILAARGAHLVVQANPELYRPDRLGAHHVVFPTGWELGRYPDPRVMPAPVARDRLPPRPIGRVETVLHVAAPAMLDRNGTRPVLSALAHCTEPFRLLVHVADRADLSPLPIVRRGGGRVGNVEVEIRTGGVDDYWDIYRGADALVIPRRYGGLSLTMQEAASLGMPVVASALSPQRDRPGVFGVAARKPRSVRMRGGRFDVWDVAPDVLAEALDRLVSARNLTGQLSAGSDRFAETIAWHHWTDRWRTYFEEIVE